jgi:hypothetical protein
MILIISNMVFTINNYFNGIFIFFSILNNKSSVAKQININKANEIFLRDSFLLNYLLLKSLFVLKLMIHAISTRFPLKKISMKLKAVRLYELEGKRF